MVDSIKGDAVTVNVRGLTSNAEMISRARTTVWKDNLNKGPSEQFISDLYFSEHSPIRDKWFSVEIKSIKYWLAMHLCRHNIGFTSYISTQRDDRRETDVSRDELPQGSLVNMSITLNAQAFINVSRKRLCNQSHRETIEVWEKVIDELSKVDRILARNCAPNCVYRGGICPEGKKSCMYHRSDSFKCHLQHYLSGHEKAYWKE